MPELKAPTITLPDADADADDLRVGHLLGLRVDALTDARVVIVGFPTDEGVRRNGGRAGAAVGPDALRQAFYRMTPDAAHYDAFVDLLHHTVDLGNLVLADHLEEDQEALGEVLAPLLRAGVVPVVLGGGHETAFGHFLGYVYAGLGVSLLNWDAHPDVRPLHDTQGHSGSSFRQALLHFSGTCQGYTVAGLQPQSTALAHLGFVEEHGGRYLWHDALTPDGVDALYAAMQGPTLASFDLDAVDQSQAPGVSAPAAGGLPASLWLHAAHAAGRTPHVRSLDLVELNPYFDVDQRTARLAALTLWHFLRGFTGRAGAGPG